MTVRLEIRRDVLILWPALTDPISGTILSNSCQLFTGSLYKDEATVALEDSNSFANGRMASSYVLLDASNIINEPLKVRASADGGPPTV